MPLIWEGRIKDAWLWMHFYSSEGFHCLGFLKIPFSLLSFYFQVWDLMLQLLC